MLFKDWLKEFLNDKKEISVTTPLDNPSLYEVHRFVDTKGKFWEYARTYTGRILVRTGSIESDGVTIVWQEWKTLHDVKMG